MTKFNGMPAAASPAESIKLALELLRKLEASRRGAVSAEALLTLMVLLLVLVGSFGIGIMAAATADAVGIEAVLSTTAHLGQ